MWVVLSRPVSASLEGTLAYHEWPGLGWRLLAVPSAGWQLYIVFLSGICDPGGFYVAICTLRTVLWWWLWLLNHFTSVGSASWWIFFLLTGRVTLLCPFSPTSLSPICRSNSPASFFHFTYRCQWLAKQQYLEGGLLLFIYILSCLRAVGTKLGVTLEGDNV